MRPEFVRAVVDTLLPGDEALPPGSAAGVAERLPSAWPAAAALRAIALAAGGERQFASAPEAERTAAVGAVERDEPRAFRALAAEALGAYFEADAVLQGLGWRAGPAQPEGYPLPPFDEGLLAKALARGRLWREASGAR